MPRRKKTEAHTESQAAEAAPPIAAVEPQGPDVPALPEARTPDTPPASPELPGLAEPATAEDGQPPKQWGEPYKAIVTAKDFEMGEDRRFKQRVFKFREKPEPHMLAALKENGFTYRAGEKAWTIQANAATRELADRLAQEFAGPGQAIER